MHNSTSDIYPNTTATHTHTHAVTRGQSQHTMLLFPHAYIHAQSLVMVSSSSLLFSVLPFVACGGEGGWVVTLTQICHIASQHHSNHLNSLLNILSAEFHTQTTCNVFFFVFCNESHTATHAWHQHVLLSEMYRISIDELTNAATNNDQVSLISPQRTVCGCINTVMFGQNDNSTQP